MANEQSDDQPAVRSPALKDFLDHLAPVVEALGGQLIEPGPSGANDTPVRWRGEVVAQVRVLELHGALERLVGVVEREVGGRLDSMSRSQKQAAVRRLDELGAFLLRGAVEDIAQLMGVSRVTLYSYVNAIRPPGT